MAARTTRIRLVVPPELKQKLAEGALEQIREDTAGGLGADGQEYDTDWRGATGDLMGDAYATSEGKVVFPVDYAESVNARAPFAGIAPQSQHDYELRVTDPVRELLRVEEEK